MSSDDETGVSLISGLRPIKAINGKEGGGSYTVNEHGDAVSDKVVNLLAGYKTDGTQDTVWRHTLETLRELLEPNGFEISSMSCTAICLVLPPF